MPGPFFWGEVTFFGGIGGQRALAKVNYVQERREFDQFFDCMIHSLIVGVAYPLCILLAATDVLLQAFAGS
ncbi:MAG: hypothetical protein IT328_03880 [Caldilineaceae bacterium]|nr:hypothetical protein [Caldilineaceae bacterium]